MADQPVEAVWFWRYTIAPFRAVYGRRDGPYSKDYLQTSGECSELFDRVFGRKGEERYPIAYVWPGGRREDVVKPGGGYDPPHDRRLNFRWPFDDAPAPWKLAMRPGPVGAFPGDPSRASATEANEEWARFNSGRFEPWLLAVKLQGESHNLHVRGYMGSPPPDRQYASTDNLPPPLSAAMGRLGRPGCGTYVAVGPGSPMLTFDPDRVFDAWSSASAITPRPPEFGLVLDSNEALPEGDISGVSYEYPATYASNVMPGTPFVYYRSGGGSDPGYFGTGLVGESRISGDDPTRLICQIGAYKAFEQPVPYRTEAGDYFEPDGARPDYYVDPVRSIPLSALEAIVAGATLVDEREGLAAGEEAAKKKAYISSELARRIDEYAMDVAEIEVVRRFPAAQVKRMPHNNPGYDIRASEGPHVVRYVEVKGTAGAKGAFFISEGERLFAQRYADRFSLCVVLDVDVEGRTHDVSWHDGPVEQEKFELRVRQWQGRVPPIASPARKASRSAGRQG